MADVQELLALCCFTHLIMMHYQLWWSASLHQTIFSAVGRAGRMLMLPLFYGTLIFTMQFLWLSKTGQSMCSTFPSCKICTLHMLCTCMCCLLTWFVLPLEALGLFLQTNSPELRQWMFLRFAAHRKFEIAGIGLGSRNMLLWVCRLITFTSRTAWEPGKWD